MAGAGAAKQISLPKSGRQGKLSFALTPLADAMFQLLIFFMLSSSLAPYSLITLAPGQTQAAPAPDPAPQAEQAPPTAPVIWNLGRDQIRSGRDVVALDRLNAHVAAMPDPASASIILFTERSARVQDIATTLNVLTLNRVGSVQLVSTAGR